VDVNEDQLVIHGTRHQPKIENVENKRRVERSFGEFRRTIRLPKVDRDDIVARSEHGVLIVTLPKAAKSGSRRVVVSHDDAKNRSADPPAS
jgi:HSP20 family protein